MLGAVLVASLAGPDAARGAEAPSDADVLKRMSLQELLEIEVTSVSKRPERLGEVSSALQVVSGDAIRRSGASRLPEALRLASNLQVAQIDTSQWAISARGFNSNLANKLLVLIDGRTVYSPLFAGVFWDVQDVLLEDVERIEVISGPGATLWGANAVNGVINITTRPAAETQGAYGAVGGGSELRGLGEARYGGVISPNAHYRVYGKFAERDGTVLPTGADLRNDWSGAQGGFRVDWRRSDSQLVTLQGDLYGDKMLAAGPANDGRARGGNVLGRWTRDLAVDSALQLQIYYDRASRTVPGSYEDALDTFDLEVQHRVAAGTGHDLVWGGGLRIVEDNFRPGAVALIPPYVWQQSYSIFAHDEIALLPDRLLLTLGSRIEHNEYTGLEVQPSLRLAWKYSERARGWGAVSRAVRTPSRLDRDFASLPGPDFDSEDLLGYELGCRLQPTGRTSLSLVGFYHDYDDLRSIEPGAFPTPVVFDNGQEGESYGADVTADLELTDSWRLRAGYTALEVDIRAKPGSSDQSAGANEAADSRHHFLLHSSLDLPARFAFDQVLRTVSHITNPVMPVPGYTELDLRLAWRPSAAWEVAVVGQNLLHSHHLEFGDPLTGQEIERNVYAEVSLRQ